MAGRAIGEAYGADTVVRLGLIGDPNFMERTLQSLSPGVLEALQDAASSMIGNCGTNNLKPSAVFLTGAAAAIAALRAEELVAQIEQIFPET